VGDLEVAGEGKYELVWSPTGPYIGKRGEKGTGLILFDRCPSREWYNTNRTDVSETVTMISAHGKVGQK